MQKNKWNKKVDWIKSGSTYIQQCRTELYDENKVIAVGDIYFRLNKYLTGVTFTYINSLNNIYKKDLLTGDGNSIVNMYNEYDVIDRCMKNIIQVDIAADTNIDLDLQWFEINGVKLKPGHLVLLKNQKSEFENDIYYVDNQYFLEITDYLSTREKSEKFSCSVKLGKNFDKQFFLVNNGFEFPINHEPKYFIEGKSFILKNIIKYDGLYNTRTDSEGTSKIIFTDIDLARKQIVDNIGRYSDAILTGITALSIPDNFLTINYHYNSYIIRSGLIEDISFTGVTSDINNIGYTTINIPDTFNCEIDDYINLQILSGSTVVLDLNTFIKDVKSSYIILEETIPSDIITNLQNCSYTIKNYTVAYDWYDAIEKSNLSPYSDFFTLTAYTYNVDVTNFINIQISPKENIYDKYFDYDGISFDFDDSVDPEYHLFFSTTNQYVKYNLFNFLNQINNTGFTNDFSIFNENILSAFTYKYTDDGKIKLSTSVTGITNMFKPYTFVYAKAVSEPTLITLVYDVNDYEIIIAKPKSWTKYPTQNQLPEITSIQNIDGLEIISKILYDVYCDGPLINYNLYDENEKKYIAKSYGELLDNNLFFRLNVTGILYENDNNEYVLKLYDLGKNFDGKDQYLQFISNELIYVGSDRITRLPVSLKTLSGYTYTSTVVTGTTIYDFNTINWNVLNGGENDVLINSPICDSGENVVLSNVSVIPLTYNVIKG